MTDSSDPIEHFTFLAYRGSQATACCDVTAAHNMGQDQMIYGIVGSNQCILSRFRDASEAYLKS